MILRRLQLLSLDRIVLGVDGTEPI